MHPIYPDQTKTTFTFTPVPSHEQCGICLVRMDKQGQSLLQHQAETTVAAASSIFHTFHPQCLFDSFFHSISAEEGPSFTCPFCRAQADNTHEVFLGFISRGLKPSTRSISLSRRIQEPHLAILNAFTIGTWESILLQSIEGDWDTFQCILNAAEESPEFRARLIHDPLLMKKINSWLFFMSARSNRIEIFKCLFTLFRNGLILREYETSDGYKIDIVLEAFKEAVSQNYPDILKLLLELDVISGSVKCIGFAYFQAAEKGYLEILKLLVSRFKMPEKFILHPGKKIDIKGYALTMAVKGNRPDILQLLLESGLIPEEVLSNFTSWACAFGAKKGFIGILEVLLPLFKEGKIPQEFKALNGETSNLKLYLFQQAVNTNNKDMLKFLLESGLMPEVALSGDIKMAAFELAVEHKLLDAVRWLLESDTRMSMNVCGATSEVNMKTWALLWAGKHGHIETLKTLLPFLEDGTIPETFTLSDDEVVNAKTFVLELTVQGNHAGAVSILLESTVVQETAYANGIPATAFAFQMAVTKGLVETLTALLPFLKNETIPETFTLTTGRKINTRERGLAAAQKSGRQEVVDLLTDYFAKNPSREGSPSVASPVEEKRVLRSHSAQTKRTSEPDSKALKKAKNS